MVAAEVDGALLWVRGRDVGASDITDPAVEAVLSRLADCLVGCE